MNHLDEGTIHAWLDGAVDAARSREIESHIAECAQCAAAVAEARGFVAGASRILNALDDVPANVTPKRAPAVAPRRQWRAAPWVSGIAAALVLTIGVTTWNREGAKMASESVTATSAPVEATAQVITPPPIDSSRTVATSQAAPTAQTARTATTTKAAKATKTANTPRQENAAVSKGAIAGSIGDVSRRSASVAAGAGAVADRDQASLREARDRKVDAVETPSAPMPVLRKAAAAAPAPAAVSSAERGIPRRPVNDTSLRLEQKLADRAGEQRARQDSDVSDAAGCYRVPLSKSLARTVMPRVEAAVGAASGRAAPSAARAPSRVSTDYVEPKPPALVLLDSARHPLGYDVRAVPSDTTVGWWKRVGADSVQVDLRVAGLYTFARADRVSCPKP
jgi:anti-sigma factor RsiW